jgi:hypothetical protein
MTPIEAAHLARQCYTDPPTYGKVGGSGRAVVYGTAVGFPGSDNIACWLADLDTLAMTIPTLGLVQEGFWRAWNDVALQVMALPTIDVTLGHSEGAALALLCAANLCLVGRPPKQVFAFEPPRISADDTIAKLFAAHVVELHLYRNGNDVVPIVPRLTQNWQHPGPLTQIGIPHLPFPNVEDHYMANVIMGLK